MLGARANGWSTSSVSPQPAAAGRAPCRRIAFAEEEINLELVSRSGDQQVLYTYPIEGNLARACA
jgi:hypothetical protein